MKKWILVIVLYGLGTLFMYDVMNNLAWISELLDKVHDINPTLMYYYYILLFMIPILLVLMNYFILRIRAKNPAFTFVNAMFITVFIIFLMISTQVDRSLGFGVVFEGMVEIDNWKLLWEIYPAVFIIGGVNFFSGIVISEAKSKGAYLTAEFIYLLTGMVLAILSFNLFI